MEFLKLNKFIRKLLLKITYLDSIYNFFHSLFRFHKVRFYLPDLLFVSQIKTFFSSLFTNKAFIILVKIVKADYIFASRFAPAGFTVETATI